MLRSAVSATRETENVEAQYLKLVIKKSKVGTSASTSVPSSKSIADDSHFVICVVFFFILPLLKPVKCA